jgi:hypothetical protein
MSPEQIQDRQVTHQTDIYSLGVVMYQLLTGRLPFSGSSRGSLLYQIVNIDAPPPSALRRGLTTELDRIVMRAIAKSTSERYTTWAEFSRDLAHAFRHLSVPDESTSDTEKFTTLRAIPMFRDFRDVELWELLRIGGWRRVPAETAILREGDQSDVLYVLVEGEATVSRRGVRLDSLQVGQCFGEIQYFETASGQRSTAIASTLPCTLLEVQAAHLRQASDALQMQLNRAFIRLLVSRLEARDHRLIQQAGAQAA